MKAAFTSPNEYTACKKEIRTGYYEKDMTKSITNAISFIKRSGTKLTLDGQNESSFLIDLTITDNQGNILTTKNAYKKLSQKFHGTGKRSKSKLGNIDSTNDKVKQKGYIFGLKGPLHK